MSCSGSTERLTSSTSDPSRRGWRLFITELIRGQESWHRVKMNETMQTRSAKSASLIFRPERSTSWKAPSLSAWSPRSCAARGGAAPRDRRTGSSTTAAEASTVKTTIRIPRR